MVVYIRADEFRRFKDEADAFDPRIVRELRKAIKKVGEIGVDAARKAILQNPPDDQPGSVGSREQAAAGIRTVVSFGARSGGVKITATNTRMDPDHKGFVAAYEKQALRHPVFGQEGVDVTQPTNAGWFGKSIADAMPDRGQKEIMAALDIAVRSIGATGR